MYDAETLRKRYHDGRCGDDCRAHDPHANWSHHEMAERLAAMRAPGPSSYDAARGKGEDPSDG